MARNTPNNPRSRLVVRKRGHVVVEIGSRRPATQDWKEMVKGSMGLRHKLAAWILLGWVKEEGPQLLKNILGSKGTSVLALVGVFMATWAGMERTGQIDLLSPSMDDMLMQIVLLGQSFGLFISTTKPVQK